MTKHGPIRCVAGDQVFIRVSNSKNPDEHSTYRITINKDSYKGDELEGFLFDTTGYMEDNN